MSFTERTEIVIGKEAVDRLAASKILVFGVGGVGGYAVEALARCGVGHFTLIDPDEVSESNINRQIIALSSTVGRLKTEVIAERISDINPNAEAVSIPIFYSAENADAVDYSEFDFVIDAIDTVSSKLLVIEKSLAAGVPVISSMGAGNKLDPSRFRVTDIYKTSVCPLARVMRAELKKRSVKKLPVVFSDEPPITNKTVASEVPNGAPGRRSTPGSLSFVPSAAGLVLAGYVIRELTGI